MHISGIAINLDLLTSKKKNQPETQIPLYHNESLLRWLLHHRAEGHPPPPGLAEHQPVAAADVAVVVVARREEDDEEEGGLVARRQRGGGVEVAGGRHAGRKEKEAEREWHILYTWTWVAAMH